MKKKLKLVLIKEKPCIIGEILATLGFGMIALLVIVNILIALCDMVTRTF